MAHSVGRPVAVYSSQPASSIDVTQLRSSHFLVRDSRKFAYRDAEGRVNVNLLRAAHQQLDQEASVPEELRLKLGRWLRHAERWEAHAHDLGVLLVTLCVRRRGS